jgi:UDP-GlcNAc:undecaprenyl-phosphate GlcNAc-1-phosphate transferase
MIGHELGDHLGVVYGLVVAFAIVVLLTPAVGGMARVLGVVDRSGRRSVPRLGGLALFLGIFVPSLAFLDLSHEMRGLLLGAAVATTVGAVDDFRGLRWWEKLAGQLVAASIPAGFGIWMHRFTFPVVGVHVLPSWLGIGITVFGIVAVMNMVNFLDGLDGLAAGVCGISAATFALIELDLGRPDAAILAAIVFGATLGFLRHNFYPARIFMGDSGALLLGFTLAGISVEGLLKTASLVSLFLPLAVLAVPIADTSFVVAKRIKHRLPVYERDRSHLHHRFLAIGFTQTRAVLTIYVWCATLAAAALATRFVKPHPHGDWRPWAIAIDAAIGLVAVGMSVYIVYLLEIVKLANPYIRRREQNAA